MNIQRILSFGRNERSGNAAIVVEDSDLSESERLLFAQKQDASATVFVDPDGAGNTLLDFYYPHMRSLLCLHATLAASAVLFGRCPGKERMQFFTSMRRQILNVTRTGQEIFIDVTPQRCPTVDTNVTEVAQLLRIEPTKLIGLPGLASVGSTKLLVEVEDRSMLDSLRPDLAAIVDWSRKHGVSGLYTYCRIDENVYAGRNFNHLESQVEDAATGVAAGALALLLKKNITLLQGDVRDHHAPFSHDIWAESCKSADEQPGGTNRG